MINAPTLIADTCAVYLRAIQDLSAHFTTAIQFIFLREQRRGKSSTKICQSDSFAVLYDSREKKTKQQLSIPLSSQLMSYLRDIVKRAEDRKRVYIYRREEPMRSLRDAPCACTRGPADFNPYIERPAYLHR